MKKILFSVAILAAFASCSKTEVDEIVASSDLIAFSTLNDRVTKSATENSDSYQVYASYYGDVDTPTSSDWYFNDEVSDSDATASLHYWPTDGSTLNFYAYAPSSYSTTAVASTTGVDGITIDYATIADGTEDFTVATPVLNKTATVGATDNAVDLVFSHMLSKVTFNVVLSQNLLDAGYELDEDTYSVDFKVANSEGTMNVLTQTWVDKAAKSVIHTGAQSYNIYPQTASLNTITVKGVDIYGTSNGVQNSDPTVDGVTLKDYILAAAVTADPGTGETGSAADITDDTFAKGKHYTITFTIDGGSLDENGEPIIDGDDLVINFTSSYADSDWTTDTTSSLDAVD